MDVGAWLRSLGLGQYEAAFRENEIDFEVLPDLTDADLEKLSVLHGPPKAPAQGDRRSERADGIAPNSPAAKIAPKPHDTAERRQLTVMFCDLVGSTAMSARLDPEDMRGVVGAYHRLLRRPDRAGPAASSPNTWATGSLAYFGYPQAHEHDAERAVQAGLALVEATPKLETAAGVSPWLSASASRPGSSWSAT